MQKVLRRERTAHVVDLRAHQPQVALPIPNTLVVLNAIDADRSAQPMARAHLRYGHGYPGHGDAG